ncbi:MAG: isoprenylcysteine carboxylmethyltransferase family protein [Rhizobiales bacterium]|nr:isoprenylcysteine carboxylmethyltransferase family protein [Hyphomicrobiales bacterium]
MTAWTAKVILMSGAVAWFLIRLPHQLRAARTSIAKSARGPREAMLLTCSLTGLGLVPLLYILTGVPKFADYPFTPLQGWLGALVFLGSLWLFHATHRTLGRNWSDSLEVRTQHNLVTAGPYRLVRHPMYSAFFLWALAQVLLLPNWLAGPAGLVGFGTLFAFRVGREERLMLETFGAEYRAYMQRTARIVPWIY